MLMNALLPSAVQTNNNSELLNLPPKRFQKNLEVKQSVSSTECA